MNTHASNIQENKSRSVANTVQKKQEGVDASFKLEDNRPETTIQRKLQEMANSSIQVSRLSTFQDMADTHQQGKRASQLKATRNSNSGQQHIQLKEAAIQRVSVNAIGQTQISTKLQDAFEDATKYLTDGIKALDTNIKSIKPYFHRNDIRSVKNSLVAMLEMLVFIKAHPVKVNSELTEESERELVGYRELNNANKDGGAYTEGHGENALISFLPNALAYNKFNLAMTIIHEIAHATPSVKAEDIAYGQHRFFMFINEFPGMAIKNADSFAFAVAALNGEDLKSSRAEDGIEELSHNFEGSFFSKEDKGIPPIILQVMKTMAFAENMWNQAAYQLIYAQNELSKVKQGEIKIEKTLLYKDLPFQTSDIDEQEKQLKAIEIMALNVAEITSSVAFYSREKGEFGIKKGIKSDRLIVGDRFDKEPQPRLFFMENSGKQKTEFLKLWKIFLALSGKDLNVQ
jgi:hypothetical protein